MYSNNVAFHTSLSIVLREWLIVTGVWGARKIQPEDNSDDILLLLLLTLVITKKSRNMGIASMERSERAHPFSEVHILKELWIYIKFKNYGRWIWKVRARFLFSTVSLSVHVKTQEKLLSVSFGRLEIYRFMS